MSFYRNGEGYYDPTAGAALTRIERAEKKKAEIEKSRAFEKLCCQFTQMADKFGLEFPGQIWLRDKKSGYIFKK